MVNSCFFCETLLSDYHENLLSPSRKEEIKVHLSDCDSCRQLEEELSSLHEILSAVSPAIPKTDLTLKILENLEAKRGKLGALTLSKAALFSLVPIGFLVAIFFSFPQLFPWTRVLREPAESVAFVPYFPLAQGASEILEEQGNWLRLRNALAGNLWEEGGISPEDFEKTFQLKAVPGDLK